MKKLILVPALVFASSAAFSAPTADWSGFYAGLQVDHSQGHNNDAGNSDATKQKISGIGGGIQAGHHWQLKNDIVLGVEASFTMNDISKDWKDRDNNKYSSYYREDKIKQSGTLNAKFGYAFDRFLPYVTAGMTVARGEFSVGCDKSLVSATNGCKTKFNNTTSNTAVGFNAGAGVMYQFSQNFSSGVEYLYTNLGTRSVHISDPNYPTAGERKFKTDYSTVALKVNYQF